MPGRRRTLVVSVAGAAKNGETSDAAHDVLERKLREQGVQWEIAPSVLSQAAATVRELYELLEVGEHVKGPITASIAYDDFDLVVTLEYEGTLPYIASDQQPGREMVEERSFAIASRAS